MPLEALKQSSDAGPVLPQDVGPELDELCRQFHVRELVLFGSANTDEFDPATSDIDLLADFETVRPEDQVAQ